MNYGLCHFEAKPSLCLFLMEVALILHFYVILVALEKIKASSYGTGLWVSCLSFRTFYKEHSYVRWSRVDSQ
jgi:hypothetical protein